MPQGIALIPLRLKFSEPPNLGSSSFRIERFQAPPPTELVRWPGVRGMDLRWLQDVELALTRRFEYEEGKLNEWMYVVFPELTCAFLALQILSPSPQLHLTLAFDSLDSEPQLQAVGVPYAANPTAWASQVRYRIEELSSFSLILERIQAVGARKLSRPTNALSLYLQGLRAEERNMRTLLWSMGLDALTMASNRSQFCARVSTLFGPDTLVFPASASQQPQYTVSQIIGDLYTLRSEIAHGSQPSKPFQQRTGFLDLSGDPISAQDTWADVLEQSAMFLLHRMLKATMSTDLFQDVQNDKPWRRNLESAWAVLQTVTSTAPAAMA